jgi:hypothetical protein
MKRDYNTFNEESLESQRDETMPDSKKVDQSLPVDTARKTAAATNPDPEDFEFAPEETKERKETPQQTSLWSDFSYLNNRFWGVSIPSVLA